MRQALAGMLWSKQYFLFDVDMWLREHGVDPLRPSSRQLRNREWFHMISDHVMSMPDKWEYPWFAAWDLAFHTIALATVDIDFAKQQLDLLLEGFYLHPTGQIPAYEWNFSDVNPPVHGWATIFLYRTDQALRGKTDLEFLKRVFGKLRDDRAADRVRIRQPSLCAGSDSFCRGDPDCLPWLDGEHRKCVAPVRRRASSRPQLRACARPA
jgi:hypothetical protein